VRVNSVRIPATASQASGPAPERKPMTTATTTTRTRAIRFAITEVSTCPHSTADLAIGIDWNRSNMPPETSMNSRYAV
jgi:hypothetical protein